MEAEGIVSTFKFIPSMKLESRLSIPSALTMGTPCTSSPEIALLRCCKIPWDFLLFVTKRDVAHPELNQPLLQLGSNFPVKVLLCVCEDGVSDDEFGHTVAPALESLMNSSPRFHGSDNHAIYRQPASLIAAGKQPVCHWLKDRDMLLLLKKMYGWNPEVKLEDIIAD